MKLLDMAVVAAIAICRTKGGVRSSKESGGEFSFLRYALADIGGCERVREGGSKGGGDSSGYQYEGGSGG